MTPIFPKAAAVNAIPQYSHNEFYVGLVLESSIIKTINHHRTASDNILATIID